MVPKDVHVLIPGTWESITLDGEKDFTELRILKERDYFGLSGQANVHTGSLYKRCKRVNGREGDMTTKVETGVRCPGDKKCQTF